jgi:predicted phosphoribosyltransferase
MFYNRNEAGMMLASRLRKYQNTPGVVLAVPRGGVPVAYEVAKELNLPLEIILVKKIGHPSNKEYAIGAAGLKEFFVIPHADVTKFYIEKELQEVRCRLMEMQKKFMGDREPQNLKDKTVIVIDDGVATGNTLLATVRILKKEQPERIIIATPVISKSAAQILSNEVDEVIAVMIPETFYGVGAFYDDFTQVSDEEVITYMRKLNELKKVS